MLIAQTVYGMGIRLLIDSYRKVLIMKAIKTCIQTLIVFMMLAGLGSSCKSATTESATPALPINVPTTIIPSITLPPATSSAMSRLDLSCWPVKPLQEGNNIKGSLIYANYAIHTVETNHIFVWDVSSFHSKALKFDSKLIDDNVSLISSDGEFIAVSSGKSLKLISSGDERSFPLPNEHVVLRDYLPDGRILLVDMQNRFDNYREGAAGFTDTYYILSPPTGEIIKRSVFLPNLASNWKGILVIQYSPDMKYVLYRSASDEHNIKFTLYDLAKNEIVWIGPLRDPSLRNDSYTIPAWRPDSRSLTNMYYNENGKNYYSISLDGEVSPITSFGIDFFESTFSSNSWWSVYAVFPNWSPNGRYLVSSGFQDHGSSSMNIWDDKEKVGYKPCLPDEEHSTTDVYHTYWSFVDSSHFMVHLSFAPPTPTTPDAPQPWKIFKTYILDLDNKIIYELPEESKRGEFSTLYQEGNNLLLGWVNWEIP
jgi:hypothetical protein